MNIKNRSLRRFRYFAPVFCSIAVLSTQLQAGPTIQLNGDKSRDGMADSGSLGYVGGNTRIGVSIDRDLQGQADINQIIHEDDSSATSAEAWFGYKLKDDDSATKGFQGGGVKLNHQWVNDDADTVHKVFGAYDRNTDDQAKATLGYGQETEDLFWSGHVSKGMGDEVVTGDVSRRAYDLGVGGEVGTFIDSTLTRVRAGLDYEFGTDYADNEDRPSRATISAGVEQFFHDTPHSVSLDVSGHQVSGGNDTDDTNVNARVGYRYEFGGNGAYQSEQTTRRRRVEIPGTPAKPARAAVPAIPATPAVAAPPAQPARAAIPPKYERRAVTTPGHEFVKTTMKLENETFFKLNSAKLTPSATRNLDKIVSQIRGHGYLGAIRITGNTCGMGDPVYDQRLSEKRANAVRNYLVEQGFNPDHLIARGLGKGSPKYDRSDNDFKNRRVDLEYVTERSIRQQSHNKVQYKDVLVQEGRPATPAQPARPGRAGHAGRPAIPAAPATPATPSRFVWKTEVVKSAPIWIKRALRNTVRHNKTISTYTTQSTQAPKNDSYTLDPTSRESLLLDVLNNDGEGYTLSNVSTPEHGEAIIENGKIRYTPRVGYSGTDTFTYVVENSEGQKITATVNVVIPEATDEALTATDDAETTPMNTRVTIDVIENDTNPSGSTLTITDGGAPAHGSTQIDGETIIYTPTTGFSGADNFTYTIENEQGEVAAANVAITITSTSGNQPPNAVDDTASTAYETAVTIPVAANDTDPEGGSTCVTNIASNPTNGYLTIEESGTDITYTPFDRFSGTDTFVYTACDDQGATSTATVTVTVDENSNQAPTLSPNYGSTYGYAPVRIRVLEDDSDPEGDTLAIVGIGAQPTKGIATVEGDVIYYEANAGTTGTDTFSYIATDNNGNEGSAIVTIEILDNNLPTISNIPSLTATLGETTFMDISSYISDSDGDSVTVWSADALHGQVYATGSGFNYTPHEAVAGDTDTIEFIVRDNKGGETTGVVTVIIQ